MQAIGTEAFLSEVSSVDQKAAAMSVSSARLDSSRASADDPLPAASGGATPKALHICLAESLLKSLTSAYRAAVASDAAAGGGANLPYLSQVVERRYAEGSRRMHGTRLVFGTQDQR